MEAGRTIGQYTLIERVGAGGMATVYRAHLNGDATQLVAIKVLSVHLAANETLRIRFEREAKMAARLHHPHLLPVRDFGEDEGMPYIVMKLIDGGTLDRLQEHGPLDLRLVARILAQVAGAMDYAHSQGVIHRDIKPENILIDAGANAYLSDFGIAYLSEGTDHITGSGGFMGTAAYASPEQCRGEDVTLASDIYSLGVVLYEMLTGKLPYRGASPLAIMHQHISEPVPNPLRDRADLPIGLAEVMRKALAKLPAVRYQTATAMSSALNEALRPLLGTKPLSGSAPPIGPNPVFDKPSDAYAPPPPLPDRLFRDLAPTQPALPDRAWMQSATPLPEPALDTLAPEDRPPDKPAENDTLYLLLLVLTVIAAAVAVTYALLAR